jgi:FtsZ-binding cell division protein ZapB
VRPRMAKGGRPKKEDGDQETRQVRVFGDVADKLADLALVYPKTTAQVLDPLIRAEVEALHEKYKPLIEEAKAALRVQQEALDKARQKAEQLANEQTGKRPKRGS